MDDRIEKEIVLKAAVSRVWRALTDHREFGAWFQVKLEGPFVEGTSSRGQFDLPGHKHVWNAFIEKIEPERYFAFTWHPYAIEPGHDYSPETPTRVEFHLEPAGQGTRLRVVESGFARLPPERRQPSFRANTQGWHVQLQAIAKYVEV